ncbi:hypothetical protein D3C87_1685800 [compost metagenome]
MGERGTTPSSKNLIPESRVGAGHLSGDWEYSFRKESTGSVSPEIKSKERNETNSKINNSVLNAKNTCFMDQK